MSYARKLAKMIDADLVERIEASGRPPKAERPAGARRKVGRPAGSYRGARRNEARSLRQGGERKPMITYAEIIRLNAMHAHRNQSKGDTK